MTFFPEGTTIIEIILFVLFFVTPAVLLAIFIMWVQGDFTPSGQESPPDRFARGFWDLLTGAWNGVSYSERIKREKEVREFSKRYNQSMRDDPPR